MGCFDTIIAKCPECGVENYFQTKSGDCLLADYNIKEAPVDIMRDANRHTPQNCEGCNKLLVVDIENRKLKIADDIEVEAKQKRINAQIDWLKSLTKMGAGHIFNQKWKTKRCYRCERDKKHRKFWVTDMEYEPTLCGDCGAHIHNGICLNACHLSKQSQVNFVAMISQAGQIIK